MKDLTISEVKKIKTFKIAGETFKYGRESRKCGNALSPRWIIIFEDGTIEQYMATSEKEGFLKAMVKIVR